jgi:hypothetical protein
MNTESFQPVPRTSLEPACLALPGVIRERRVQAGLPNWFPSVRIHGCSRHVHAGKRWPMEVLRLFHQMI